MNQNDEKRNCVILPAGEAEEHCLILMSLLKEKERLDFDNNENPSFFQTGVLFGEGRGQMFGILVCRNRNTGKKTVLKAFSGQYSGCWLVPGWSPPLIDPDIFESAVSKADPPIKKLTEQIDLLLRSGDRSSLKELKQRRRELSRIHMDEIHRMYTIKNFAGGQTDLFSLFTDSRTGRTSIPAGTGDCCAPKLLNQAVSEGLQPLSLAEFFWGRENRSGTKQHGRFYPPCREKCAPLLRFMLKGTGFIETTEGPPYA